MPDEQTKVSLSRPTSAAAPITRPSRSPGFRANSDPAAQADCISRAFCRRLRTSKPIAAAGTVPKFDNAE